MSSTGASVFAALSADPTVSGIVASRIYPNVMPQGTRPVDFTAIVYSVISDVPENAFEGASGTRLRNARVQVDCYAKRYEDGQALAEAVDAVLSALTAPGFQGWRESTRDLYDDESQLHRVSSDFTIWR